MKQLTMLIVTILLALAMVSAAQASRETFQDIESHWAKLKIEQGVQKGYVSGFPDGTFRPNEPVTRAQFIRMLTDSLQLPSSQGGSPWFQPYVAAALEMGVLDQADFSDYTAPISRLEIMRLLSRGLATDSQYADYLTAYSGLYSGDIPYVDYRDIPDADVKHVAMVIGAGLVSGYPDFSLGLQKTATRAEAVVMIENFLEGRLKTPEAYRGLRELKEVAETGTNATTVSLLEPLFNFVTEPVIEKTSKYDAKLKRAYVLPSKGELSMFDRLMLWDRKEVDPAQFDEHVGFVFSVFEVAVKKDFSFNLQTFHTKMQPNIMPMTMENQWFYTAHNTFDYYHASLETKLIKFKAGETYDVVLFSRYSDRSINGSGNGIYTMSEDTSERPLLFINPYHKN